MQSSEITEQARLFLTKLNELGAKIENIWVCDTEFVQRTGDIPQPVCAVFLNLITGEQHSVCFPPTGPHPMCPVDFSQRTILVGFQLQAEVMSFLQCGWGMPARMLDLSLEWRHLNNEESKLKSMKIEARRAAEDGGLSPFSLLGVASLHGIQIQSTEHKEKMRDKILQGFPFTEEEQNDILGYCAEDVRETAVLFARLWPQIADPRSAVYRAHSVRGFSAARTVGIPMDTELLPRLQKHWQRILDTLFEDVRRDFPVFGDEGFDIAPSRWKPFLAEQGWLQNWPLTRGGRKKKHRQPRRDQETLRMMAEGPYPKLAGLREVLAMRSCTKLGLQFPVGRDGRSRLHYWDFGTVTGRCSPSSSTYVLAGGSPAFRHLVKPGIGEVIVELDWSAQEMYIAAYLSGDRAMKRMLHSGDPYVAFGALAGLLPPDAKKKPSSSPYAREIAEQHAILRDRIKAVCLGVLYGKTPWSIAKETGMTVDEAVRLLRTHRRLFPRFWEWLTTEVSNALARRQISTRFGWTRQLLGKKEREWKLEEVGATVKKIANSLQNFPMQSHGSEMLRLALVYAAEEFAELYPDFRYGVCAPLHDAVFMVTTIDHQERDIAIVKSAMERASLDTIGAVVPLEIFTTVYPERFVPDDKTTAVHTWSTIMALLAEFEAEEAEENSETREQTFTWKNRLSQSTVAPG